MTEIGNRARCMDMDNSNGMTALHTKVIIYMDANMVMEFLLSHLKSTIKANGSMANRTVEACFMINRALFSRKVFGRMAYFKEKLIDLSLSSYT
jgi:hypothetical protein